MRIVVIVLAVVVVGVFVAAVAIRRLSHDPGVWHVDPLTAPTPSSPNAYRVAPAGTDVDADAVAPTFALPVDQLASAFDRVARADGRVDVVGGSPVDRFVTYVQTSTLFGFPDYISVRFLEADDGGSTVAVFSRSRLGHSDLGVNKQRVERWLSELSGDA